MTSGSRGASKMRAAASHHLDAAAKAASYNVMLQVSTKYVCEGVPSVNLCDLHVQSHVGDEVTCQCCHKVVPNHVPHEEAFATRIKTNQMINFL